MAERGVDREGIEQQLSDQIAQLVQDAIDRREIGIPGWDAEELPMEVGILVVIDWPEDAEVKG